MKTKSKTDSQSPDVQMLTAEDVAERLQISVRNVWRQVSTRQMPEPIKIGRLARWPLHEIREWIERGCPPSDHAR